MDDKQQYGDYFSIFAEELLFWKQKNLTRRELVQSLFDLNNVEPYVFLIKINGQTVQLLNKSNIPENIAYFARANSYCAFLNKVVNLYPLKGVAIIALYVSDGEVVGSEFPTFAFQKHVNSKNFLLPDVDFLDYDCYQGPQFQIDENEFYDKLDGAIFVGSTTGSPTVTFNKAQLMDNSVPRINSALYFKDKPEIVFKLPIITQYADAETYEYLMNLGVCGGEIVSYQEQFRYKFMISMDGNGATCSRVALTLKSNSVLLKYDSQSVLFYFKILIPWFHYIPIKTDADVLEMIHFEKNQPGIFSSILRNAQQFYGNNLTEEKLIRYTAELLHHYTQNICPIENYDDCFGVRKWNVCQLSTQVGKIVEGAIETTGRAGHLIYGPYISLPPGPYQVFFHGTVIENGSAAGAKVEVIMYNGAVRLAEAMINEQAIDGCLAMCELDSDIPYSSVEFRIWVEDESLLRVSHVELRKDDNPRE